MRSTVLILVLLLMQAIAHAAYVPPLERIVSIEVKNTPLREALNTIALAGRFSFSYNAKAFNAEERISLHYNNKPVRYLLDRIFKGTVSYKTKGEYVILLAGRNNIHKASKPIRKLKITGYIIDSLSRQRVSNVSIYEPASLSSAISDPYGYFSLELQNPVHSVILRIWKEGYKDASVSISTSQMQGIEVALIPVSIYSDSLVPLHSVPAVASIVKPDIVEKLGITRLLLTDKLRENSRNLKDVIFRKVQFSFLPAISTNKLISGSVRNDYSLNLVGGYSQGINKVEVGGVMNIDRGNVKYMQAAGFGNIVGGKVTGCQAAGFMNIDRDSVKGMQAGGFMNIDASAMKGTEAAGFCNINQGRVEGCQLAGFLNHNAGMVQGMQGAGFVNINARSVKGVSAAGFGNSTLGSAQGVQAAGAFNTTADTLEGVQVAGLFNYAGIVKKGVQLAPFNFADSCKGIPLGFFSFVRHGYHQVEASADELFHTNIAFRTGVRKLHNIFIAGIQPENIAHPLWTLGYGLGTSIKLARTLNLDLDVSTHLVNHEKIIGDMFYHKLYAGLEWRIYHTLTIAAGPTLNFYVLNTGDSDIGNPFTYSGVPVAYFYNKRISGSDLLLRSWLGWKVGIRIL